MVCKMMKKGVIGAALGAGILALAFGTSAPSYLKTAFHKARSSVKGSVPVEFEIDRAKNEIAALQPAIHEAMEAVVKAEFEVISLNKEIVSVRADLNSEGQELQALNDHLKKGDLHLTGGAAYSEKDLRSLSAQKLDHYKLIKGILADKQETLKIRQKNVASARKGLDALKTARRDLSVRIEGIEARLTQINASRAASEFVYDESAVGRAKQTVADLELKLEQMARIDELKGEFADRGTVSPIDPTRDVSREIDAEFSSAPKAEKVAGDKY